MPLINDINLESFYNSTGDLTGMLNISIKNGDLDYNISGISNLKQKLKNMILIQNLYIIHMVQIQELYL